MVEKNSSYITAQEITKRYKIPYPTINHYTNLGFLSIVKRDGNKRLYLNREVKDRLVLIQKMVDEGYPLRLIRNKIFAKGLPAGRQGGL